jgi:hypothetical protein
MAQIFIIESCYEQLVEIMKQLDCDKQKKGLTDKTTFSEAITVLISIYLKAEKPNTSISEAYSFKRLMLHFPSSDLFKKKLDQKQAV